MTTQRPDPESGSYFFRALVALGFGWGGWRLWSFGQSVQQNGDTSLALSAVCWLVSISSAFGALRAWDDAAIIRGAHKRARRKTKPNKEQGSARWATVRDCKKAGMLKPGGLFLGQLSGKDLYDNGEGSVLSVAPPGSGKTVALALQHLLRNPVSTIVVDVKAELLLVAKAAREKMGHRVWVIAPWADELNGQFRGATEIVDDGFDPCRNLLDPEAASIVDDCMLCASLLLPESSGPSSATADYFREMSQDVLVGFMLLGLHRNGSVTLPELRAMIMTSAEDMAVTLIEMSMSDAFSGVLAEYGNRILLAFKSAPKEFAGAIGGTISALRPYDAHGPLGKSVRRDGVDFRTFRDQPTTVFVVCPSDRLITHGKSWLAAVINTAQQLIARDRRPTQAVFLADEFPAIGYQPSLLQGQALFRGAGIRYHFLAQSISQIKRLYGESWREFLGGTVTIFGPTSDFETLQLLSNLIGNETYEATSLSENMPQQAGALPGMSTSTSAQGRPLLRPEDVRKLLGGDNHLIFLDAVPPVLAKKVPYYAVRKLKRKAKKNPYYKKR